jgi:hypothetical protein
MSKSTSTRSRRLLRAGLATGAITAILLASATAAFAANVAVTFSPTSGPAGGGTSVTATGTGAFPAANTFLQGRMTTGTCPATFGTTSPTNPTFAVTRLTNDTASFTTPPHLVPGSYKVCIYGAATAVATATPIVANGTFTVTAAVPVLSPTAGPITPGGTITATAGGGFLSTVSGTIGATLTTGTCAPTYSITAPNLAATATKNVDGSIATLTTPSGVTTGNSYKACFYNGTTVGTSTLLGGSTTTYTALPSVALSPAVGPTGGTNTITATSTTAFLSGITTPGAFFTRLECPAVYVDDADTTPVSTITKISNFKAAFTVPVAVALTGPSEATASYKLCVYEGQTAADDLISAPGAYTIAPILSVTSVTPAGGPAQGGSRVTVVGTGFPTDPAAVLTASIGGAPLLDIERLSNISFSGTTTAHSPGSGLAVSVSTAAGTKSGGTYAYSYGITVTPNTAPNNGAGATFYLDVQGAGFDALAATFGSGTPATSNDAIPHVYLVDGTYSDVTNGAAGKTVPQVDECTGVVVISDVELICQMTLTTGLTNATPPVANGPVPNGTYTVTVVDTGAIGATESASIISSGSTFTVAPY